MANTLRYIVLIAFSMTAVAVYGITANASSMTIGADIMTEKPDGYPQAIFGGGCFWCVESEFRALDGVKYTRVGYMGGALESPTYGDITTGQSGHAEVVEVTYDPEVITYETLVHFFLTRAHDPTQLNKQGVDVGTQYRSVIFTLSEEQHATSQAVIKQLTDTRRFNNPIVTEVITAETFWEGEDYHQQYYEKYEASNGTPHIRVLVKKGKKMMGM